MLEVYFLFALGLVWILFATIQDLRTSEIANWLNYSLIIFAMGFRFFYSLFEVGNFSLFYQGLIGLGLFFVISNLFYYGKMFAGGDASLMFALGAILPINYNFYSNLDIFFLFLLLFLFAGAVYGLIASFYLGIRNWKAMSKEFRKQFKKNKRIVILAILFSCIILVSGFYIQELFYLGIFIFILPYLFLYAKSVDESCMVRKVSPSKLTLGDWLYKDVRIGKKVVKANWDGLQKEDIKLLKKRDKEVYVRFGVQFAPVFLIAFVILFFLIKTGFRLF